MPAGATYKVDITDGTSTVTLNTDATIIVLTIGSGNTLALTGPPANSTNSGSILLNGDEAINGYEMVNSGTIDANTTAGSARFSMFRPTTNTGTLEATNGGKLVVYGGVLNSGGNITASGAGSVVTLYAETITGGTLNTSGGGTIESAYYSELNGVIISTGSTHVASNNTTTDVIGTITNDGLFQVNGGSGTNGGLAAYGGKTTLTGGGTVTLSTAGGGAMPLSGRPLTSGP